MLNNKKGFTLIELMVVISIIGILAALSAGVVSMVTKQNKVTAATATLDKLGLALDRYYQHHGVYPPTPENPKENAEVISALTGDLNHDKFYDKSPESEDVKKSGTWRGPYLPVDAKYTDGNGNLLDLWGLPYRYIENNREAPDEYKNIRAGNPNPDSYLLYSCGPDRKATDATREEVIDFTLPNNKDNIKNWEDE